MPQDTNAETTAAQEANPTTETQTETVETFDREYVEKLRRENAAYRTKAKQAEDAAEAARLAAEREKLDEVERLKAEKADAEKRASEIEARAVAAERRAALTGKVADASAALKLLDADKHLTAEGDVNVTALLEDYPFLAPAADKAARTPSTGAGGTVPGKQAQVAALREQLAKAITRQDRIRIQRQIDEAQKG